MVGLFGPGLHRLAIGNSFQVEPFYFQGRLLHQKIGRPQVLRGDKFTIGQLRQVLPRAANVDQPFYLTIMRFKVCIP